MDASVEAALLVPWARGVGLTDADVASHQVTRSQVPLRRRTGAGLGNGRLLRRRFVAGVAASVVATLFAPPTGVVVPRSAFDHAGSTGAGLNFWTGAIFDDRTA